MMKIKFSCRNWVCHLLILWAEIALFVLVILLCISNQVKVTGIFDRFHFKGNTVVTFQLSSRRVRDIGNVIIRYQGAREIRQYSREYSVNSRMIQADGRWNCELPQGVCEFQVYFEDVPSTVNDVNSVSIGGCPADFIPVKGADGWAHVKLSKSLFSWCGWLYLFVFFSAGGVAILCMGAMRNDRTVLLCGGFFALSGMLIGVGGASLRISDWLDIEDDSAKLTKTVIAKFDSQCGIDVGTRVLRKGMRYGQCMNLYPAWKTSCFENLQNVIYATDNTLTAYIHERHDDPAYANWFLNDLHIEGFVGPATYVLEILDIEGDDAIWYCGGDTNGAVRLSSCRLGADIKSPQVIFKNVIVSRNPKCALFDRGFLMVQPGKSIASKFRVSLFAGTDVSKDNFRYVEPGQSIPCPLPQLKRDGYAFEGWYDGERRITEESRVEKRESHTLKARWRKL